MRSPSIILITSFMAGSAAADQAGQTIQGMDQCFAQARSADAICGRASNAASARLDCLRKARDAEEQCLERVRAAMDWRVPVLPSDLRTPQPSPEPEPNTDHAAAGGRVEKPAEVERPEARSQVDAPVTSPSRPGDAPAQSGGRGLDSTPWPLAGNGPSSGWIVGETVSPVDFSPLLVAQINSAGPNTPDAPSALVLRCRAGRTEMSLRTQGSWHAGSGVMEVVFTDSRRPPQRFRWPLASNGKSASLAQDAIAVVQGLVDGTMTISVNDGNRDFGTATFELAGINAVRKKLAERCRWPAVAAQSNDR